MKFDIIIKDATVEELNNVANLFGGNRSVGVTQTATKEPLKVSVPENNNNSQHKAVPMGGVIEPQKTDSKQDDAPIADAPTPITPESTGDVELDAEGLPWDERIHSGNKKKKADGTWHAKKGADKNVDVEAIKAELKGSIAPPMPTGEAPVEQPAAQAQTQPPAMPTQPPAAQNIPPMPTQPPAAQAQTQPPAMPTQPPAAQPSAPVSQGGDFSALMTKVQQGMTGGTIDPAYMQSLIARINTEFNVVLGDITGLMQNQPMIDAAFRILNEDGK